MTEATSISVGTELCKTFIYLNQTDCPFLPPGEFQQKCGYQISLLTPVKSWTVQLPQYRCHEIIAWQLKLRSGKKTKSEEQTTFNSNNNTVISQHSPIWLVGRQSPHQAAFTDGVILRQTESLKGERN